MTALRRAVTAFLLLKLSVLVANLAWFPVLRRSPGARLPAQVSLLVPVRDEAGGLAATLPAILRQGAAEVILLDDESADGSGALARSLTAASPQARVVTGTPAPPGWVGKNWACHQLAAQASGSLLMFCDADVQLADGAVGAAAAEMTRQRADVFSVFPRQVTASLGERLVTPLIDDVLLCFLPFGLLAAPVPAAATANGALLAFTRDAYEQVGGHPAVRGEIVEDVALARRARAAGLKLGLALGGDLAATRMYDGYRAARAGLARGLLPVTGGSRRRLVLALAWHLLAYTLPPVLAPRQPAWRAPLALGLAERALVEVKTGRRTVWQALLMPLVPLAAVPVVAKALRREQSWKGRPTS